MKRLFFSILLFLLPITTATSNSSSSDSSQESESSSTSSAPYPIPICSVESSSSYSTGSSDSSGIVRMSTMAELEARNLVILMAAIQVDSYDSVLKLLGYQSNALNRLASSSSSSSDSDSDVMLLTLLPRFERTGLQDLLPLTSSTCPQWLLASFQPLHLAVSMFNYKIAALLLEMYEENMEAAPFRDLLLHEIGHAIEIGFSRFILLAIKKIDRVPIDLFGKSAKRNNCVVLSSPSFDRLSLEDVNELAMAAVDNESVKFLETLLKLAPLDEGLLVYAAKEGKAKAFDALLPCFWSNRSWGSFDSVMNAVWQLVSEKRNVRMMISILKHFDGHARIPVVQELASFANWMFHVALQEMDMTALQAIGTHLSAALDRDEVTEMLSGVLDAGNYLDLQRAILAYPTDMLGPFCRAILKKGLQQDAHFNRHACRLVTLWNAMKWGDLSLFTKAYSLIRQSSVSRQLPVNSALFQHYCRLMSKIQGCYLEEIEPEIERTGLPWGAQLQLRGQAWAILSTYTNEWGYVTGKKKQRGARSLRRTQSE